MSETVVLKQFNGMTVSPKDDAILYDAMIGSSGLIFGCDLTYLGAGQIRISEGRGVIKGRMFVVQEHTINVPLSAADPLQGRISIKMDLSNAENPVMIEGVTAAELPDLVKEEDCNYTNGIYELELGRYEASTLVINNLVKTIQKLAIPINSDMVIDDRQTAALVNVPGVPVGCQAFSALNNDLTDSSTGIGFRFGIDPEGNYGYIKDGADTVTPFKSGGDAYIIKNVWFPSMTGTPRTGNLDFTVPVDATNYDWYLVAPPTAYANTYSSGDEARFGTITVRALNANTVRLTLTGTISTNNPYGFFPYSWNTPTSIIGLPIVD